MLHCLVALRCRYRCLTKVLNSAQFFLTTVSFVSLLAQREATPLSSTALHCHDDDLWRCASSHDSANHSAQSVSINVKITNETRMRRLAGTKGNIGVRCAKSNTHSGTKNGILVLLKPCENNECRSAPHTENPHEATSNPRHTTTVVFGCQTALWRRHQRAPVYPDTRAVGSDAILLEAVGARGSAKATDHTRSPRRRGCSEKLLLCESP